MTTFTLYNSAWRNAADALVWMIPSLFFLLAMMIEPLWWAPPGFTLFALAAAVSWRRAFDRSLQVRVDEHGIWTRRFDMIGWEHIAKAWVQPGKMSYLAIKVKDLEPWMSRMNPLRRALHCRATPESFLISLPLQHTGVDQAALSLYLKQRQSSSALA
ncbi:hypothetical protein [Massilia sp. GCM10023247]|uniref:hypothetical protein n=1 Tax=Massilia sp. GCM10023247 TaxID=3252643 RepID=UPI003616F0C2